MSLRLSVAVSALLRPVLVTGGRNFRDVEAICSALNAEEPTLVIHGQAAGVDAMADEWARYSAVPVLRVPANWNAHGKAAGPIRNGVMVEIAKRLGAVVMAFPGGAGTADCVRQARAAGLEVREVPGRTLPPEPRPIERRGL